MTRTSKALEGGDEGKGWFILKWANGLVNLITDIHVRGPGFYFSFKIQHRNERRNLKITKCPPPWIHHQEGPHVCRMAILTRHHWGLSPLQHHAPGALPLLSTNPSCELLTQTKQPGAWTEGKEYNFSCQDAGNSTSSLPTTPSSWPHLLSHPFQTPLAEVYLLPIPLPSSFLGLFSPPPYLFHFPTMSYFVPLHST